VAVVWSRRSYTKEQFIEAWNSSLSIAEVAKKLGCNVNGGGYLTLKSAAQELGLSYDHMTGQGWNKGHRYRIPRPHRPLKEILVENSPHRNSSSLKDRLYKAGILEKKCSNCGIVEWRGKPAPLALDHVNGVNTDNRIENLRILCYNCHGQTETFAGKNMKK